MDVTKKVWGCCASENSDSDCIVCSKCGKLFHLACIVVEDPSLLKPSEWKCPECCSLAGPQMGYTTPVHSKGNITVRPQKRQALNSPQECSPESELTPSVVECIVESVLAKEMKIQMTKLTSIISGAVARELKTLKEEIQDFKESMNYMSGQFDDILTEQQRSKEAYRRLEEENAQMKSTINDLSTRLNNLEQHARANNVEIQCVPEKAREDLPKMISTLGNAVNCAIKQDQIVKCTRIAKMNKLSSRPRSIVVQLATQSLRDRFLAACMNYNKSHPADKLNTVHVGLPGPHTPIYIGDHLSSANKALHAAARLKAKEKAYKFVWVKSGKVFMKKDETSEYIFIKDQTSLDKIK